MTTLSKVGLAAPCSEEKAERSITEAVLIFYRALGLPQKSINRIVEDGLQGHRIAMKKAVAHILDGRVKQVDLVDIIGPVPGIGAKSDPKRAA